MEESNEVCAIALYAHSEIGSSHPRQQAIRKVLKHHCATKHKD